VPHSNPIGAMHGESAVYTASHDYDGAAQPVVPAPLSRTATTGESPTSRYTNGPRFRRPIGILRPRLRLRH
jgi:hypothetical protein